MDERAHARPPRPLSPARLALNQELPAEITTGAAEDRTVLSHKGHRSCPPTTIRPEPRSFELIRHASRGMRHEEQSPSPEIASGGPAAMEGKLYIPSKIELL
jgi:hypothetical protein